MTSRIAHYVWCLLIVLFFNLSLTTADLPPFGPQDIDDFDKAKYGIFSEHKYKSTKLVGPRFLRRTWDPEHCKSDDYYFFAPRGMLVGHPGPMIVDNDGSLIWHSNAWPVAYGLDVQRYRGEAYLTFWSGNDQVIGHGSGYYYMLDKHYRQFKMIGAANNLTGDLHEFKITTENTAIITAYRPIPWDLSKYGRKGVSWIWDCYFQEIDIETNQLLFEWKATDYFTFDDCFNELRGAGPPNNPWDWFHINSIDKDKHGNFLISARYSHALTYIHGKSGRPMWHLGGKNNTFKDLSDGKALNFAWQHDARWVEDLKTISLFDNAAYFANQTEPARGMIIEIDVPGRTAKLVQQAVHPLHYVSESQGSMQVLKDDRMLVGFGSAAALTEFDKDGNVQCDMEYGALRYHEDNSFSPGAVMSYRTYKHPWEGRPVELPRVMFIEGRIYVSWNGATEIRSWLLEGSRGGSKESDWKDITEFPRTGFESDAEVDDAAWKLFRMIAKDGRGKTLGVWLVYSAGEVKPIPLPQPVPTYSVFYVILGALLTLIINHFFKRRSETLPIGHTKSRSSHHCIDSDDADEYSTSTLHLKQVPYANGHVNGTWSPGPTLKGRDASDATQFLGRKDGRLV